MQEVREVRACAPWEIGDPAPDHVFGSSLGQELIAEVPAGAAGLWRWLARSVGAMRGRRWAWGAGALPAFQLAGRGPPRETVMTRKRKGPPPEVGQSFPQNSLEWY